MITETNHNRLDFLRSAKIGLGAEDNRLFEGRRVGHIGYLKCGGWGTHWFNSLSDI